MPAASSLRGVWPAALTPFDDRLVVDIARLVRHCRVLLQKGCRGISLFGTTGEGTALSADERMSALSAVIAAGVPRDRLLRRSHHGGTGRARRRSRRGGRSRSATVLSQGLSRGRNLSPLRLRDRASRCDARSPRAENLSL